MILHPKTLFSVLSTKVNNLWHHEVHRLKRDMENMKAEAKFEETERSRLDGEAPACRYMPSPVQPRSYKPFGHRHM